MTFEEVLQQKHEERMRSDAARQDARDAEQRARNDARDAEQRAWQETESEKNRQAQAAEHEKNRLAQNAEHRRNRLTQIGLGIVAATMVICGAYMTHQFTREREANSSKNDRSERIYTETKPSSR